MEPSPGSGKKSGRVVEARNAVNTLVILFLTVSLQPIGPQFVSPCGKLGALAFVLKQRNTEPAGIRDAGNLYQNDCSRSFVLGKVSREIGKFRLLGLDHRAAAVHAQNLRRPLEGA